MHMNSFKKLQFTKWGDNKFICNVGGGEIEGLDPKRFNPNFVSFTKIGHNKCNNLLGQYKKLVFKAVGLLFNCCS